MLMTLHLTLALMILMQSFQSTSINLLTWLKNNHIKTNPEKCHLLLSRKTPTEPLFVGLSIKTSTKEALHGVLIGFDSPVTMRSVKSIFGEEG